MKILPNGDVRGHLRTPRRRGSCILPSSGVSEVKVKLHVAMCGIYIMFIIILINVEMSALNNNFYTVLSNA